MVLIELLAETSVANSLSEPIPVGVLKPMLDIFFGISAIIMFAELLIAIKRGLSINFSTVRFTTMVLRLPLCRVLGLGCRLLLLQRRTGTTHMEPAEWHRSRMSAMNAKTSRFRDA